jgi:hypothetical protein
MAITAAPATSKKTFVDEIEAYLDMELKRHLSNESNRHVTSFTIPLPVQYPDLSYYEFRELRQRYRDTGWKNIHRHSRRCSGDYERIELTRPRAD